MSFSNQIISWFRENGRALPWRETRDPYAIWLSEIILQQTRIVQGLEYWERFMAQYPTVEALAAASEDDVLKLWQGLGYYSRARNLHAAAKRIVEMGKFPDTLEGIKSLKFWVKAEANDGQPSTFQRRSWMETYIVCFRDISA